MRVLGLDPGLRVTGWGVIESSGHAVSHVANGSCRSLGGNLGERLASLYDQLSAVVAEFEPEEAAVEKVFVNSNSSSSLLLGHARAVAILAAAKAGIPVSEYAPNSVKKTVTGVGHAQKRQITHMVGLQLPGVRIAGADASDALAVAIAHAVTARFGGRLQAAISTGASM
ncbi:MAG: crossover junction endodeoxyribonuclease RuvC [Rhodobacteraceae bacterium]|nr:crossover junction endodeoxyribonuclease RuvC [Paracoccaceae bacterium]